MTNTPADPSVSLDFAQLRAAQAEAPSAPAERKETLTVGKVTLPLVKSLTPLDMIELQDAQESGNLRQIIEAVPRLVAKHNRDELLDYLMSDPDDEADRVDFNDVIEEFGTALEAITARPTVR